MYTLTRTITFLLSFFLLNYSVSGQHLTQTIRGQVLDQDSRIPIIGANVYIIDSDPLIGTATDEHGNFRLEEIPVGRISLGVSYLGYEGTVIPNIIVNSAKEVVLQLELVESVQQMEEVVISANQNKTQVLNEMALVSARSVTVDEGGRYAGSWNDPARIVSSFAGITGDGSGSNEIVVRGNSPRGILWRLEGVEIPNPNHFADEGSTGGPINALNSLMLANSDFFTGAFAPEYGNAYSGVFDIHLRNGNSSKREYSLQAGTIGLDFTAEGPFKKSYAGSYLVNYRYSSLELLDNLGVVDFGGVPRYQDLSFKFNLPTKNAGYFSLFGLGGKSSILSEEKEEDLDDLVVESADVKADLGVIGLNHSYIISNRSWIKSSISASENGSGVIVDRRDQDDTFYRFFDNNLKKYAIRVSTHFHQKINAADKLQIGGTYSRFYYDFDHKERDYMTGELETYLSDSDQTGFLQAYGSWKHRFNENMEAVGGLHFQYFTFNHSYTIEPRLSFSWQVQKHKFFAGFGLHSKLTTITEYLAHVTMEDGKVIYYNKDLELPKAVHYVIGHDLTFNPNTHLKTELYYQKLYDVPVGSEPGSTYSVLNSVSSYSVERLTNEGKGRNIGIEITLERFLSKGFYFLLTSSIYDSKYTAIDGKWRDTRFNGRYTGNVLAGKEYLLKSSGGKQKTLSVNAKILTYGGLYFTPIDLQTSIERSEEVRFDSEPYSVKGDQVFRIDLGVSYKINRPKTTQVIRLDLQNLTNQQALVEQYYNHYSRKIEDITQLSLLPIIFYELSF